MADIVYTIAAGALPNAYVGEPYAIGVPYKSAATVFTAQSVSTGALPTGLALDAVAAPGSLRISGTPTAAGVYTFQLSGTDTAGAVVSPTYTITVYTSEEDVFMQGGASLTNQARARNLN